MTSRQKEGFAASLRDEKAVLKELEKNYTAALADIKKNIKVLQANPVTQSKAYQLDFQRQLEKQLTGILDVMTTKNFTSIDDYVKTCYQQGFLSTMYDLQGQGVPLVLPIDQNQVLKAVSKTGDDIKLSNKVGSSTKDLKKQVLAEIQRGFATQMSYTDIARNISAYGEADMNRAMRIARTEGHRVQNEATLDAQIAARDKGADIVKQWDSTFDGSTRETHGALDGQIRELEKPFEVAGKKAMYPGGFGDPAEDCNCRCAMLQRARWAVEGETSYKKWNNETGGIIECNSYDDFKQKYLKSAPAQPKATVKKGSVVKPKNESLSIQREANAEHFKTLGAQVDKDGMVTLYHATAKENISSIIANGFRPTTAPINGMQFEDIGKRVFFGYDEEWIKENWSANGAYDVIEVKIPAEYLHQSGQNTLEVFVEGAIKKQDNGVWVPDILPTSTAWDRLTVKRWKKRNGN